MKHQLLQRHALLSRSLVLWPSAQLSTFAQSTLSAQKPEEVKFSAFLKSEKTYTINPQKESTVTAERFVPKPEYTQLKFDPNVRHTPMKMPNHLLYRYMYGIKPQQEPESAYVAVHNKGQTWHLFNAEKIPLGRMAEMIAVFIRGKHKPTYSMNRFDIGDKCVVVNAAKLKVTGDKMNQKLYRHHTGYPGGLKEILMRDLVQRDPAQIVWRAVKGKLAKNTIRNILLERNLVIHEGPYHDHIAQKLPQFIPQTPIDINKQLGIDSFDKADTRVIYESNSKEAPEEFKDYVREIDSSIDVPLPLQKKTHKYSREQQRKAVLVNRSFRNLKKYRGE